MTAPTSYPISAILVGPAESREVDQFLAGGDTEFGISRKTGYKWLKRYEEEGAEGLREVEGGWPKGEHRLGMEVVDAVLLLRKEYPPWGPKKLRAYLLEHNPKLELPTTSTIGEWLKRYGQIAPRTRRLKVPGVQGVLSETLLPDDVWAIDFKGDFVMGDGQRVYPLTLSDVASRYVLKCEGELSKEESGVRRHCERAFCEFGLPHRIRMDNGTPFVTRALGGLSRWMVWLVELGIAPERIEAGHPEQNGVHERMHRTLKEAVCKPPQGDLLEQQRAFDLFRQEFNDERPHEALSMKTPSKVYMRSYRPYPCALRDPEYEREVELRRVQENGTVMLKNLPVFLTTLLSGKTVGVKPVGEREWEFYYGPVWLAHVRQGSGGELRIRNTPANEGVERLVVKPTKGQSPPSPFGEGSE